MQIGPVYVLIVDAIDNDKDPVTPTTIENRLSIFPVDASNR